MRYFLTSDIHSYYTEFKKALDEAGFDVNNDEHVLVILGDLFDRGKEAVSLYKFIASLPKERLVLVRGNHEDLFMNLTEKLFPQGHDYSNGTVDTFLQIVEASEVPVSWSSWDEVIDVVKKSDIYKLIADKSRWVNYFEFDKYVCVHSFVPVGTDVSWRDADEKSWNKARWGCPYELYDKYGFDKGKTIVVGHWHVSAFHEHYEGEGERLCFAPYISEGLIALDACTAYSGKVNVICL